jgi:ferredoxin
MKCLKEFFDDVEAGRLACEVQCINNCPNKAVEEIEIKEELYE